MPTFIRNGEIVQNATHRERFRARRDRFPGRGRRLEGGADAPNRHDALLDQIRNVNAGDLNPVPVYYANRSTGGLGIRSHGYVIAGNPGRGRKSGAVFYGVGGDPKRGGYEVNQQLMKKVNARSRFSGYSYSNQIRSTMAQLAGNKYSTKEEFHQAYSEARASSSNEENPEEATLAEIKKMHRLAPKTEMEMWPKQPSGYEAQRPNTAEGDVRAFENYHRSNFLTGQKKFFGKKLGSKNISLRHVPNVRSIDLLEARQQFLLQQRFLDEQHGRSGTGIPSPDVESPVNEEERRRLAVATPRFQRLPPLRSETVANCNAGASTLLQSAMDRFPVEEERGQVRRASPFGLGSGHRMRLWNPLQISPEARQMPRTMPRPRVRFLLDRQPASQRQVNRMLAPMLEHANQTPQSETAKKFPGEGHRLGGN